MRRPSRTGILRRGLVLAVLVGAWIVLPAGAVFGDDGRGHGAGRDGGRHGATAGDRRHDDGRHRDRGHPGDSGGVPEAWGDNRSGVGARDAGSGSDRGGAELWRWWWIPRGRNAAPVPAQAGTTGTPASGTAGTDATDAA